MRMTLAVWPFLSRTSSGSPGCAALASEAAFSAAFSTALSGALSSGFCTWYLTILRSILMVIVCSRRSQAPVIPVPNGVKQICRRVDLAVVIDLLIATHFDHRAVLERELVERVLQVLFLHQHALERFRIEAEGGAALQPLLMCIQIDVLELRVGEIRRHVRRLRNR